MTAPRSAHEQAKRAAGWWAKAQIEAQGIDPHATRYGISNHARLISRWTARLRAAGIITCEGTNGFCPPVSIDLTRSPSEAAHDPTLSPTGVNNQLRAVSRLLWLSVLIAQPERTRSLGRIYTPSDCRSSLTVVADLLDDPVLWGWVYRYGCELAWRYRETHTTDHKSTRVLVALNPYKNGIPTRKAA